MTRKSWLIAGVFASLCASPGCVTCDHHCHKALLEAGPECPIPVSDRQKVYVFLVNGLTPGFCGLEPLRDKLAAQGFPKIYFGQAAQTWWMAREMQRIHADDPSARFVVVGYDLGGSAASQLAVEAVAGSLPIEAVVLLDPMGKQTVGCGARTIVVTSGGGTSRIPHTESVSVPEASHFGLPTHPTTVALMSHLLAEVAARVVQPPTVDPIPVYEHATSERRVSAPERVADTSWLFLLDQPGGQTQPLDPVGVGTGPLKNGK